MNGNKLRTRLGLIGLFVLVGFAVAVLLAITPAGAVTTGDAYPGFGDWQIDHTTRVIDEEIIVYGDVNVNAVLELWNATIRMDLATDNGYMINVTTNGDMRANDTLITSTRDYREFGFTVYGKLDFDRVMVKETYNGLRVLTDDTVTIKNSAFLLSFGTGIYLEDADGTTLNNVQIQTNELSVSSGFSAESRDSSDYQQTRVFAASGGALYIKGGNPSIKDVYVSANGTVTINVKMDKYGYYYFYMYLHVYVPIVGVDSDEMTTISGIHVRDSEIDIHAQYTCVDHWTYTYAYWYLYTYGYATAVNVLNYGDVELAGCTVTNAKIGRVTASASASSTGSAIYHYAYTYTYQRGMTLFGATVDKMYSTAGPHTSRVTLKDASFENVGVLTVAFSPNYNGTVDPEFYNYVNIENVSVNKASYPFAFGISPQFSMMKTITSRIVISNSTFTNMTGPLYTNSVGAGPGVNANRRTFELHDTVRVQDSVWRWCNSGSYGMIEEPYEYKQEFNNIYDRHIEIVGCKIMDNTGPLFYIQGNYYKNQGLEHFLLQDCLVQNNSGSQFGYLYYKERVYWINNTFVDNVWSYEMYIYDSGGDQNGKQPCYFLFDGNSFTDTYITSGGKEYGLFYFEISGDLIVRNNYFEGFESNFGTIYPYGYYSGYSMMEFSGNEWTRCNTSLMYFYLYYQYAQDFTCYFEDNYGHDTNGQICDYYAYYAEQYEGDGTFYFKNNTMQNFTDTVFKMYGKMTITGNTFIDCVGYVIQLDHLSQNAPIVNNNNIINCQNVYKLSAKSKGILHMSISVSDLRVDCTGNAFYFKNMDVTMLNVTVTNRCQVAIIAEEATVDAMRSTIPLGSGEIIGNGEINVWYEIELWVEWANYANQDVSSGVPVEDALVVFYGSSGAYYSSTYTDADGHVKNALVPQWTLKGSFLSVWSPYTVTVTKAGITQSTPVTLDKDYSGADAINMLLVDDKIPDIRITSPFGGELFSADELMMRGFSTEIGSGIGSIWVAIGDGEWTEVEFDENGDFDHTFTDLPEGADIMLKAKVYDIAKNLNEVNVTISIDRTPPRLVIFEPENGDVVNEADIVIRGEYEPGAVISINGLERSGSTGTLSEPFTLSEGNNTIVVMATDLAGNSATETRTLRLDRFAPTLTVLAPRDGLVTRMTGVTVEGDVELGSDATISVYRTGTNTLDEVITIHPDGTFSHKVDLEEGENTIVVTAIDNAENPTKVTRTVYVDTMAPMAVITSPADGTVTNENTIRVTGTAEVEGITLYLNGKQVHNDGSVDRIVNLNEGENVITLRAVDLIGNEYVDSTRVYLDTEAPTIEPIRPRAQNIMTNMMEMTVSAMVFEDRDLDSVTVMGNDVSFDAVSGEAGTYQFETVVTLPKEGEVEVLIVARDDAGNVATHSIMVDYSTMKPMLFLVYSPTRTDITSENQNFYISGTTTSGIEEVWVSQTVGGETDTARVPVEADGTFSVVRTMLEGQNTFSVSVTDAYGNTNTTADYTVTYKYKEPPTQIRDTGGWDVGTIALWILVIALALFFTAVIVTRMLRRDEE